MRLEVRSMTENDGGRLISTNKMKGTYKKKLKEHNDCNKKGE